MSGPNTDYDPVEVTPLKADEVEAMRDAGPRGDRRRPSDLDALKQVRHRPRRRPLAAGAGQPRDRRAAAAGPQGGRPARRPGPRRGQPGAGGAAGRCSRPSTRSGCWSRRPSTSRCPPTGPPPAARHPITTAVRAHRRHLRRDGLGGRRGPASSRPSGSTSTRSTSGPDHPARTMQDTFWTEPAENHLVLRTHTSPGAGPHDADPRAADLRRLPRPRLPHRRVRRHAQPDVPPGRGPRRRRGHHDGAPQGHPRPLRRGDVRRGHHHALPAVVLPVHRAQRRGRPALLRLPRPARRPSTTAAPAGARAGSSGAAAASSTRACSPPAASTPSATPASPSAWASTAP